MLQPFAIHDPSGTVVMQAVSIKRRTLRKAFADQMGVKWNALWLQGYRLKLMECIK